MPCLACQSSMSRSLSALSVDSRTGIRSNLIRSDQRVGRGGHERVDVEFHRGTVLLDRSDVPAPPPRLATYRHQIHT